MQNILFLGAIGASIASVGLSIKSVLNVQAIEKKYNKILSLKIEQEKAQTKAKEKEIKDLKGKILILENKAIFENFVKNKADLYDIYCENAPICEIEKTITAFLKVFKTLAIVQRVNNNSYLVTDNKGGELYFSYNTQCENKKTYIYLSNNLKDETLKNLFN